MAGKVAIVTGANSGVGEAIAKLFCKESAKGYGGVAYVSSKAAIVGVTKNAALRFQATGIRCNAICPANITTPMTNGINAAELDPDMIGAMTTHSNMASPSCSSEDVANIALFLANDEPRALTGQIIVSDYGSML